jgi:putative lipoprotein (rSAM/lipoprotein system)
MKTGRIITGLLALLGFSGCNVFFDDDGGGSKLMYGSPRADFEIKGRVTDADGDPVRDIKIVVGSTDSAGYEFGVGITDAHGFYRVTGGDWFGGSDITVAAEDIDGDKNGGDFAAGTVKVEVKGEDYIGGDDDWYMGKFTKTVDFELQLKSEDGEGE